MQSTFVRLSYFDGTDKSGRIAAAIDSGTVQIAGLAFHVVTIEEGELERVHHVLLWTGSDSAGANIEHDPDPGRIFV